MKVEQVAPDSIRPLENNPRRHGERQLAELVKSVEQFGQYRPLVVDETGEILAGNGLYTALVRVGIEKIAVYRVKGLTDGQKKKLILSDNRLGELSNDDFDLVEEMLREIGDFEVPGYDPDLIKRLTASSDEIIADAQQFGVLEPEVIEEFRQHSEGVEESNTRARVGQPPEPFEKPAEDAPAAVASEKGDVCEMCGRPWR